MTTYKITNKKTYAYLGTYEGETPLHAVAAMHTDAGYSARVENDELITDAPGDVDELDVESYRTPVLAVRDLANAAASDVWVQWQNLDIVWSDVESELISHWTATGDPILPDGVEGWTEEEYVKLVADRLKDRRQRTDSRIV